MRRGVVLFHRGDVRARRPTSRPDCVVGLELRNVVANYPFESSHRFPRIQPNSGHGDYSRLSCGIEETQLGPRAAGSRQASDRALDDQAAGAQHISLSEACRGDPASSAPTGSAANSYSIVTARSPGAEVNRFTRLPRAARTQQSEPLQFPALRTG